MKQLKKLIYSLTIIISLVFVIPPIHTNATDWTTYTVHVTKTGNKYHMAGCGYLRSDIPINILDAISQGYTPCSRCNPPYPKLNSQSNKQESPSSNTYSQNTNSSKNTNTYSQTEGITFYIYYDSYGNPIQDTIYRGYYASWTAELYRRMLNNELDNDIFHAACEIYSSFDSWNNEDVNIYNSLSDKDREDFSNYILVIKYDEISNCMIKYSPIFDWKYYSTMYPEKFQECNYNVFTLLLDFLNNGTSQGLQGTSTFNVYTYMNNNPDLVAVFGNDLKSYYNHYIDNGRLEGRIAY